MAARDRVYEDFEPTSEWVSEPKADILLIHLPGFRRDQLRVQLSTSRVLKISGERSLGDNNRWQRFRKEVPVPSDCDVKEISAKYESGILFIRQPKINISDEQQQQQKQQQKDQQQKLAANAKPQDQQTKPAAPAEPQQVISQPQPEAQPKPESAPHVKEGFEKGKEQEDKQKKEEVWKKGSGEGSQQQGKRNGSLARQKEVVSVMFKKLKKPENYRKLIEYVVLALVLALYASYQKNYACRKDCKQD